MDELEAYHVHEKLVARAAEFLCLGQNLEGREEVCHFLQLHVPPPPFLLSGVVQALLLSK
jgi:hypothetical protein